MNMSKIVADLGLIAIVLSQGSRHASADSYSTAVLSDSPLAYWRLGEPSSASTAVDSSPHGLNGFYESSVTPGVPGALPDSTNTAAQFVGNGFNGGFVNVGYQPALDLTHSFTIEAWFKASQLGGTEVIVSNRYYGGSFGLGYGFSVEDSHLTFTAFGVQDYRTADTLVAGEWYYAAVVVDAAGAPSFYLDGQPFQSFSSAGAIQPSPSAFQIGRNPMADGRFSFQPFNGTLDEIAIYGAALSSDQLLAHYNTSIPEPSTLALAALSSLALLAMRRRR
jgi:hypothetical protein